MHIPVSPPRIVALGGPVPAAIRAMRADEPATDYSSIRELRRAIADRIEADIALLDALTPDANLEPYLSTCDRIDQTAWAFGDGSNREAGDDNGLADDDGWHEQRFRDVLVAL
ncbi:hypothetical protein C0214_13690 [Methylobacterium sp. DM1]|nr:hypothetical protein C0214_13690 [Methylobacterium sp. DM1]